MWAQDPMRDLRDLRLERLPLNIMGRAIEKDTQSQVSLSSIHSEEHTFLPPPRTRTRARTHTCIYTCAHSDSADMSLRLVWVELEYPVWKNFEKGQVWWPTPIISALGRQAGRVLWVLGQPDLHSELQISLIERPCLKSIFKLKIRQIETVKGSGMVVHTCSPSTRQAAGGTTARWDQPGLHGEF